MCVYPFALLILVYTGIFCRNCARTLLRINNANKDFFKRSKKDATNLADFQKSIADKIPEKVTFK